MPERVFTSEEKATINSIIARKFENLTADEVTLYAEWSSYWAAKDAETQAAIDAINEELEYKKESFTSEHEQAMSNMQELHDAAMARLARLEGISD